MPGKGTQKWRRGSLKCTRELLEHANTGGKGPRWNRRLLMKAPSGPGADLRVGSVPEWRHWVSEHLEETLNGHVPGRSSLRHPRCPAWSGATEQTRGENVAHRKRLHQLLRRFSQSMPESLFRHGDVAVGAGVRAPSGLTSALSDVAGRGLAVILPDGERG